MSDPQVTPEQEKRYGVGQDLSVGDLVGRAECTMVTTDASINRAVIAESPLKCVDNFSAVGCHRFWDGQAGDRSLALAGRRCREAPGNRRLDTFREALADPDPGLNVLSAE